MNSLNLVSARLVDDEPTGALCEYVVAGNGLFVFAETDAILARVPVAAARCTGLEPLEPLARLKVDRIPASYLVAMWQSAVDKLPNECAYQLTYDEANALWPWRCARPNQTATPVSVDYADDPRAVVDVHSHGAMAAFFSDTDDRDEGGMRFYCVLGEIGSTRPTLAVRVGVYGHHWRVPAVCVFEGLGPFVEELGREPNL